VRRQTLAPAKKKKRNTVGGPRPSRAPGSRAVPRGQPIFFSIQYVQSPARPRSRLPCSYCPRWQEPMPCVAGIRVRGGPPSQGPSAASGCVTRSSAGRGRDAAEIQSGAISTSELSRRVNRRAPSAKPRNPRGSRVFKCCRRINPLLPCTLAQISGGCSQHVRAAWPCKETLSRPDRADRPVLGGETGPIPA